MQDLTGRVLVVLLLMSDDVELNPGPVNEQTSKASAEDGNAKKKMV